MSDAGYRGLLAPDEPPPFTIEREHGKSPFILICDHGGRRIPRALGALGVAASDMERHIAWDIGASGVARGLSVRLDAFAVIQTYSRLVIDCNRPLDSSGSIVTRSEATDIPGNVGVDNEHATVRAREIFQPYHARIAAELDRRAAAAHASILISVHSFTPVFHATARPWHIGTLYRHDARVARLLIDALRAEGRWNVGDNEPYAVTATTDYAIPVHGERRGIPHVGIEIRQDLIDNDEGQAQWAEQIARWLAPVPAQLGMQ